MAQRASLSIVEWGFRHKPQLALVSGAAIARFGTAIAYVVLTVVIALQYGEWVSGLMIGIFNFFQALITDPLAGGLTDRIGSKLVVIIGSILFAVVGLVWMLVPLDNLVLLTITSLLLFTGYSCRDEVYAYLLRTSGSQEGGVVFGVAENIFAITTFLSSLALPYFIATDRQVMVGVTMLVCAGISLFISISLPSDRTAKDLKNKPALFNPVAVIRRGWHFVKINRYYPLLLLANSVFEGIFYGLIWFVMPLKIALDGGDILSGLTIGIYELVTIFAAGYAGYLADHYNWIKIHSIGWIIAALGTIVFLFSDNVLWLVVVGALIALGNNLFAFSASHALEANDIDHAEDGAFIGLNNLVVDLGYGLSPLIGGVLYYFFGFTATLAFGAGATVLLALFVIPLSYKLGKHGTA